MNNYKEILKSFNLRGKFIDAKPFGSGHINDTILVRYQAFGRKRNYVLRKINGNVFDKPKLLIENSIKVTEHIRKRLQELKERDISRRVLTFLKTKDDKYHHTDLDGNYWCLNLFIENAYTVDRVENEKQAFEAAKAYGRFQRYLSNFNPIKCHETIPNFHDLSSRLQMLDSSIRNHKSERLEQAGSEIKRVEQYKYLDSEYKNLLKLNLPQRITHNDTKINNVMLDKITKEGLCVLDLDTVMPGTILNDFGDMVRSFVSPALEDERDFSKVEVRLNIFEAMTGGYCGELHSVLTSDEINNLVLGSKIIVFEQAIRFLTDFIDGDSYYKVDYRDHNLNRTKNQFALLESIEMNENDMNNITAKYS